MSFGCVRYSHFVWIVGIANLAESLALVKPSRATGPWFRPSFLQSVCDRGMEENVIQAFLLSLLIKLSKSSLNL